MLILRLTGPDTFYVVDRLRVGAGSVAGEFGYTIFDSEMAGKQVPSHVWLFSLFTPHALSLVVGGKADRLQIESGYHTVILRLRIDERARLMVEDTTRWWPAAKTPLISYIPRSIELKMLDDYQRECRKGAALPQD